MKTYELLINGNVVNDYILGRISGIIYVIAGMPEVAYAWRITEDHKNCTVKYDATEEQHKAIIECIDKNYPKALGGVREI